MEVSNSSRLDEKDGGLEVCLVCQKMGMSNGGWLKEMRETTPE